MGTFHIHSTDRRPFLSTEQSVEQERPSNPSGTTPSRTRRSYGAPLNENPIHPICYHSHFRRTKLFAEELLVVQTHTYPPLESRGEEARESYLLILLLHHLPTHIQPTNHPSVATEILREGERVGVKDEIIDFPPQKNPQYQIVKSFLQFKLFLISLSSPRSGCTPPTM